MRLQISTDFAGIQRRLDQYQAQVADRILAPALNKVAAKARTEASRQIRGEFVIPVSDVNALVKIKPASAKLGRIEAEVRAVPRRGRGRSINVIQFLPATQRNLLARLKGKQLAFKIKRAGTTVIPGAFVSKGRVLRRIGSARFPVKAVQTIDVVQMFTARRVNDAVVRKIRSDLPIEVERAIRSGRFA